MKLAHETLGAPSSPRGALWGPLYFSVAAGEYFIIQKRDKVALPVSIQFDLTEPLFSRLAVEL